MPHQGHASPKASSPSTTAATAGVPSEDQGQSQGPQVNQRSPLLGPLPRSRTPFLHTVGHDSLQVGDDHDESTIAVTGGAQQALATPSIWTWRRVRSFFTTLHLLTGAGIVYLFSSYATQLRDKLGYSQLQVAMLASSGNLGLYLSGPIIGLLVDRHGPRPVACLATVFMFIAFASITYTYAATDAVRGPPVTPLTLSLYYFLLGCGSSGITLSSVSLNVRSFPPAIRGFAVGVPVSFYGLSAFLFVQVKQAWFVTEGHGGMQGFLTFITAFLAVSVVVAACGMFEVPYQQQSANNVSAIVIAEESHTSLPSYASLANPDIDTGLYTFFRRIRSYLLILTFFLAAGTGLMVIGNIGAVILALSPASSSSTDPDVQLAQATQVAVLSIFNALGRVVSGMGSDATGHTSRPWWLVASLALMSCATGLVAAGNVAWLTASTAVIGYGYGTLWSLCPSIVAEWVDPLKFGSVWGFMTCVPALSQQVTNTLFGALYDAHRVREESGLVGECRGIECFREAYLVTMAMCLVGTACALALAMGWGTRTKLNR
ncbi:major facilitator superfamily domain-containing protein [Catenaria anguillulae PL171]|uniref:Major facilitator superfamily domain-containing protein n=1 Tax=Catenaria anguillulae PL171 TaxID=765915 RepID=A0A1Y2HNN7_9FUNG|nr:major facilitator superfamily domain-containing protein [Catenaria anguillulae PL171]